MKDVEDDIMGHLSKEGHNNGIGILMIVALRFSRLLFDIRSSVVFPIHSSTLLGSSCSFIPFES